MKSTTIKTNFETDVLFTGHVPGMGHTILVCACVNSTRVYARITGNINHVYADNGTVLRGVGRLCSGSNFTIAYSSTIDDIDAEEFGTMNNEVQELITKVFEVK